jgi:hypothetical protein
MTWRQAFAFPHDQLAADGNATFPEHLLASSKLAGRYVLVRRADQDRGGEILKVQQRSDADQDIAISTALFQDLARPHEQQGVPVQYRSAGFFLRAWSRPRTQLDLIVAVLAFAATVVAAVAALIEAAAKARSPTMPFWLIILVFAVITLAAAAKLAQDVVAADRG